MSSRIDHLNIRLPCQYEARAQDIARSIGESLSQLTLNGEDLRYQRIKLVITASANSNDRDLVAAISEGLIQQIKGGSVHDR